MGYTMKEVAETLDQLGQDWETFKKLNDERLEEEKKGNLGRAAALDEQLRRIDGMIVEQKKRFDAMHSENENQRERIEELESRASSPGKTTAEKTMDEYKHVFVAWLRNKGQSPMHEFQMQELQRKLLEQKAVTIATGAPGGFAVPEEISREIERLELSFSPVRSLVKVVQVGTSDYKELVNIRGTTSGWVGESGTRSETATPSLREVTPTHGELYAYPQASEWSLDDIFFNVEAWLAEEVAQSFAVQEGTAVISGNGTSKPTGMLNTTPVLTADFASPLRAAAAYQYIASNTGTSPAAPTSVEADKLITLIYTLNSAYRTGATFVMNSGTTGAVRRLKDSQNQYLWAPGLQAGQPDMLLGYPVSTWEQIPDIGANNFPIAFGNFRRGYLLTQRTGLRITRDNVTNIGFVRFYVRRREGGIVLNNDAIKWIRTVD